MQVQIIKGNPIAIVLVSIIFTIITVITIVVAYINKFDLPSGIIPGILFVTVYNLLGEVGYYLAYRQVNNNSKWTFMSPKKYAKVTQMNEKYKLQNQKLRNALGQIDKSYSGISENDVIDKAIELLSVKYGDKSQSN